MPSVCSRQRPGGRAHGWRSLSRLVVSIVLTGVFAASAGAEEEPPPGPFGSLCGLARPVDSLIGCFPSPPPGADAPAGGTATSPPLVSGQSSVSVGPVFDPTRMLVRFRAGTPLRAAAEVFERAGVQVERRIPALGLFSVRAPAERRDAALADLQSSPAVAAAEREVVLSGLVDAPNDALWPAQSGLRLVGFPGAWGLSRGAPEVTVAVLDTGVYAAHPDLAGAVEPGWDFVNGDTDASDDHGHGTAVAGVIGARANDGLGVAGVCWLCRLLPVKVLDERGRGTTASIAEGIVWAANQGAEVINLSLGGPGEPGALDDAVRYARSEGAVVVAAAGNDGTFTRYYPAALEGVLGVAATDESDRLYSWSNRGGWVRLAAPGCNPAPVMTGSVLFCGTSSAAPIVAGLAALAYARRPSASREEIEAAIVAPALPLGGLVQAGRINASSTLALLPPLEAAITRVSRRGTMTRRRDAATFPFRVGSGALHATLTFEGATVASMQFVDARARPLATVRGRSPLRLARRVEAGRLKVRVRGRAGLRFRLTLTHPRGAPETVVRISSIPDLPTQPLPGPRLGRPVLGEQPLLILEVRLSNPEASEPQIVRAINQLRRRHRLRPLRYSSLLAQAGDAHARALGLAGEFTHDWPGGRPFGSWISRYFPAKQNRRLSVGENLLWSDSELTPEQMVEAWLNSPSHREILLARDWREIGVGVIHAQEAGGVFDQRNVYIVAAEFGTR